MGENWFVGLIDFIIFLTIVCFGKCLPLGLGVRTNISRIFIYLFILNKNICRLAMGYHDLNGLIIQTLLSVLFNLFNETINQANLDLP